MKVIIEIPDFNFDLNLLLKNKVNEIVVEKIQDGLIRKIIEEAISNKLNSYDIKTMIESRVSRIFTAESIKDYVKDVDSKVVLSNLESKILLMIEKSNSFKKLVKSIMKDSLKFN
jgi:hypothetical protein